MKKLIPTACFLLLSYGIFAQNLNTPQPSPTAHIKQNFGLSFIELSYSRPGKKGRMIFGDLVPYGKVWRTGANEATIITFGDDVTFGDKKVPAGKYGLLTIPGNSEWTVILTKQQDVTSPAAYKESEDVARIQVPKIDLGFSIESFTIMIGDLTPTACNISLIWDNAMVQIPVKTEIDSKIMAQIDQLMKTDKKPYFGAAMYYMDNGKDLNKANEWLDKATQENPDAFWIWHQKANCLAKLGKKQEAIQAANKSIELAKAAKNDDYVALNEKLISSLN